MSEQFVPLLRDNKDIHYRYKMPKLTTKVEGSGNGIKTVITNITAVARALNRPPSYPTKYFGIELGAQVTMNNDFIINGSHDADKLLDLLYGFIKKFVLCPKCNNPETELKVIKPEITQRCIACGKTGTIPKVHRLTTFIINNPPNADASETANGASKKGKKSKSKKNGTSSHSPNDSTDDKKTSDANLMSAGDTGVGDDDDGFDDEDLTIEATAERLKALSEGFDNMQLGNEKMAADLFYKMLKDKKEAGQLNDMNVQKEIVSEASRLGIKAKAALIISEVLFDEHIIQQIKQYRLLLLRFLKEFEKGKKYMLGGFEKLVGDVYKDQLLGKTSLILKEFYDNDILDEDTIFEWASKASKKYVSKDMSKLIHEKAGPFLKWLKEAEVEEDSNDEEAETAPKQTNGTNGKATQQQQQQKSSYEDEDEYEDDDDINIEYSHRVDGIRVENEPQKAATKEDLSDLNIDDI